MWLNSDWLVLNGLLNDMLNYWLNLLELFMVV